MLVLAHIYSTFSWVSPNLKAYFSLVSGIRLGDIVTQNLPLQQTEPASILDQCKSFLTWEKTQTSHPLALITYTLTEVRGMWCLTFWKTIRTNRAVPFNTALSFLLYKHLGLKYTHNGSLYSSKIPAAWGHYQKYHPWLEEETALRTSICYWMTHLCSDTCKGSSRDSQLWPLVEKICCFSLSWMLGWMFLAMYFMPFGLWISLSTNAEKCYTHSHFDIEWVKLGCSMCLLATVLSEWFTEVWNRCLFGSRHTSLAF